MQFSHEKLENIIGSWFSAIHTGALILNKYDSNIESNKCEKENQRKWKTKATLTNWDYKIEDFIAKCMKFMCVKIPFKCAEYFE